MFICKTKNIYGTDNLKTNPQNAVKKLQHNFCAKIYKLTIWSCTEVVVPGRTRNAFVEQSAREFESLQLRHKISTLCVLFFDEWRNSADYVCL